MKLRTVEGQFGVARLTANATIPEWINGPGFSAIIRSNDELTLVCFEARIPANVTCERGWSCFRSIGPFAFDETGIVVRLISPLSKAGIGVFVVCTFDGEHVLCPTDHYHRAQNLLIQDGHVFEVPASLRDKEVER